MAKSMPSPIRIGKPEMVTSDSFTPVKPKAPKPQMTPTITTTNGRNRQRTPNTSPRTKTITAKANRPRVSMPFWR